MAKNRELTDREREILELVATGASNRQIAQRLGISANTVKVHVRNIFEKTGAASRTEATLYAIQAGLVEGVESGVVTAERSWWQRGWVIAGGALALTMVALLVGVLVNPGESPPENVVDLEQLDRDRWQELAPMPTARKGLAVAAYDGKIYAIAGETADGVTNVVERYNPATDSWETLPPKPTAVTDVQAVVIGGKIYVPGGCLESGTASSTLEIFDPVAESWEKGSDLRKGLCSYAMAAFEGDLYIFSGYVNRQPVETVFSYDPIGDNWQTRRALKNPITNAGAVSMREGIIIVGGYDGNSGLDSVYFFTPSDTSNGIDPWQSYPKLPEQNYAMGVAAVADEVYILGGEGEPNSGRFLKFSPQTSEWTRLESYPFGQVSHLGLVNLGGKLFAVGGRLGKEPSDILISYQAIYTINIPIVHQ